VACLHTLCTQRTQCTAEPTSPTRIPITSVVPTVSCCPCFHDSAQTHAWLFNHCVHTRRRQYSKWTYSQLAEQALAVAHGLLAAGFRPGERAVLMVPPSLNFYALTYGMVLAGVVPVLIDPGLGRLQVCWRATGYVTMSLLALSSCLHQT
jgi:acyl-CoA synthetase (AMP-forming)/AMP-acid ligase II